MPNNPEFTANAAIQYTVRTFGDLNVMARIEYAYQGDTFYHTVQDDVVPATRMTLKGPQQGACRRQMA